MNIDLRSIQKEGWGIFEKEFPDAYGFLLHESLYGELCNLTRIPRPNKWQAKRLEELQALEIVWLETDGNHGRV